MAEGAGRFDWRSRRSECDEDPRDMRTLLEIAVDDWNAEERENLRLVQRELAAEAQSLRRLMSGEVVEVPEDFPDPVPSLREFLGTYTGEFGVSCGQRCRHWLRRLVRSMEEELQRPFRPLPQISRRDRESWELIAEQWESLAREAEEIACRYTEALAQFVRAGHSLEDEMDAMAYRANAEVMTGTANGGNLELGRGSFDEIYDEIGPEEDEGAGRDGASWLEEITTRSERRAG
jgi:hypothetical protein